MRPVLLVLPLSLLVACTGEGETGTPDTGGHADTGGGTDTADTGGDTGPVDTGDDTPCGDVLLPPSGLAFSCVPEGSFTMGCTAGQEPCEEDESPSHAVTLTHTLWVGVTEVTQDQYLAVTGLSPSSHDGCGGDCPVDSVRWVAAASFVNTMSEAEGLDACYTCDGSGCTAAGDPAACSGYRLATEAEWEYAARCGGDLPYAGSAVSNEVAWTGLNSDDNVHPVAGLAPNACGLFDMSGNVWELVHDYYGAYSAEAATDPSGPSTGTDRGMRGGSYHGRGSSARVSERSSTGMGVDERSVGFRVVRTGSPTR